MTDTPATVVGQLFERLEARQLDQAAQLIDEHIVWRNRGLPAIKGKSRALWLLRQTTRPHAHFSIVSLDLTCEANRACGWRTDILALGPVKIRIEIFGEFEIADGRITVWTDSFSWTKVIAGTFKGVAKALRGVR